MRYIFNFDGGVSIEDGGCFVFDVVLKLFDFLFAGVFEGCEMKVIVSFMFFDLIIQV